MSLIVLPALWLGYVLDGWLGEPRRWHPLVGFGRYAAELEAGLNRRRRGQGVVALLLAVAPFVGVAAGLQWLLLSVAQSGSGMFGSGVYGLLCALGLYWALGHKSLLDHLQDIQQAFHREDLTAARDAVGRIVSRDCTDADWPELRRAALESALENTSDAIVAPLFWLTLLGLPGVVLYRLVNTLDAMWGYRNARFSAFGWAAARTDDLLNVLPARLTALGFVLAAPGTAARRAAWHCWQTQAAQCDSPNAGPVMCAGAGALECHLGGPALYHGHRREKPWFGTSREPQDGDLQRVLGLIRRTVLGVLGVLSFYILALCLLCVAIA